MKQYLVKYMLVQGKFQLSRQISRKNSYTYRIQRVETKYNERASARTPLQSD